MKKFLKIIIVFLVALPLYVNAIDLDLSAQNIILYNLDDESILYEVNSNERTNIASLTKIMTSLVALNNIDDLNEYIIITSQDFKGTNGYSKAGFQIGDKVTYLDLLYGVLLPSGADAVNALVNNTLGYTNFIEQMNNLANQIGLKNTEFSNPIGKDDINNYSTAYDVASLLKYALSNEVFKKIFTTKEYITTNGITMESTLYPYKDILEIDKILGSKSGFTKGAGRCLASITNLNDVDYLLVVLNSSLDFAYSAVKDTLNIYDYYNDNYSYQTILQTGNVITTIPINWSKEKEYIITALEDVELFLKNDTAKNLEYVFDGVNEIEKGTEKGTKLGTIKVLDGDTILYKEDVLLNENIEYYNPILLLVILLLLIVLIVKFMKKRKINRKRK